MIYAPRNNLAFNIDVSNSSYASIGNIFLGAAAGVFGQVNVSNNYPNVPVVHTQFKTLYVQSIRYASSVAGSFGLCYQAAVNTIQPASAVSKNSVSSTIGTILDSNMLAVTSTAATIIGSALVFARLNAPVANTDYEKIFAPPLRLASGASLCVQNLTLNTGSNLTFELLHSF